MPALEPIDSDSDYDDDDDDDDRWFADEDEEFVPPEEFSMPIFAEAHAPSAWESSDSATLTREEVAHRLEDEHVRKRARTEAQTSASHDMSTAFSSPFVKELFPNAAGIITIVTTYWQWLVEYRQQHHADWPIFPFASSAEWSLAKFLCTSSLSKGEIKEYLKTEWVRFDVLC